jgi:hypothetical protein
MKRTIAAILLTIGIGLAGCATSDFQPYEGRNNVNEGVGGTKVVVEGVEFWANGSPPRKYAILGVVKSEVGAGWGDEAIIRSKVASRVKQAGGDAAIQIDNNTTFLGMLRLSPTLYAAANTRTMHFAVIKYIGH